MSEWVKYTGSDEQIAEIETNKNDILLKTSSGKQIFISNLFIDEWKHIDEKVPNKRVIVFIPGIGQMTTQGGKFAIQAREELGATHWTNIPPDPKD